MTDMKSEIADAGLSCLQKLVALRFLTDPWTPKNCCLTVSNKPVSKECEETHK